VFSVDMKEYRKNPDAYKGSVADVSMMIRIAITGKTNSPDLYTVMKILGTKRCCARLDSMIAMLSIN
jgi:glutamyl-tRNA synthetase